MEKTLLTVKYAAAPILWKGVSFEEIAREVAQIGFDGIEASVGKYRDNVDGLRKILGDNGLALASTYTSGYYMDPATREDEIRAVVEIAKLLPEFGCHTMISAPQGLRKERKAYSLWDYRTLCEALNEIGRRIADFGVKQVYHNHAWTVMETRLEVDILCAYTDPRYLSMGFDTGHLYLGWADPVEMVREYGARGAYLHFKDARGRADQWPLMGKDEGVWCELGAGEVDLAGIVRELDRINWQGWLSYEQDKTTKTPRESAIESLAFAKNLVAKLGQ
jgi:inosose dehydratase